MENGFGSGLEAVFVSNNVSLNFGNWMVIIYVYDKMDFLINAIDNFVVYLDLFVVCYTIAPTTMFIVP